MGIYKRKTDGSIETVIDRDHLPDKLTVESFIDCDSPVLKASHIAFRVLGSSNIYRRPPNRPPELVADLNTAVPNRAGDKFMEFGSMAADRHGNVAFWGRGKPSRKEGIYRKLMASASGAPPEMVADESKGFKSFDFTVGIKDGKVIYTGYKSIGLFTTDEAGNSIEILGSGTKLEGRELADVRICREAAAGDFITFLVMFKDGTKGIYVARL